MAYCGLIFFLSSQSRFDFAPTGLWDFDKLIHLAEYGVLAALLLRATHSVPVSLLTATLYGVSDEVHQYFVPGRSASVYDALADLAGASLVCGLWYGRKHMKKAIVSVMVSAVLGFALTASAGGSFSKGSCTFNGKKLYGKIQVVSSFPDVKVQVVTSFPDVKVKKVSSFPDKCGEWQMVDSFPDTKVQFVDSFPDVKIQYVDSFPGAN